ncbi:hypothetical protein NDU88_010580 [Pleurodeles waltl]|uniref:Uncharacterized protein n=1 Tax=Pleurodeles waltl TaxID=8319 RepID=A0AAV7QWU4_PLEWA|nr:hypothetical protein NDU88_010580 [Pleurodeles waltl]
MDPGSRVTQGRSSPDPAAHQCTGRLASSAKGLGPAALRLWRSVPRQEHSTAPAEHQRRGALLGHRCTSPQGRQAQGPPQATPACCRRRHRPRGSALPLGSSAGAPGPPAILGVWRNPQATQLHPNWGR